MYRGVKIVLASLVLLVGTTTALMFRHPAPQTSSADPGAGRLVLRDRMGPQRPPPAYPKRPENRADKAGPSRPTRPTATVLTPLGGPPPELAQRYPHHQPPSGSRWGDAIGINLPQMTPSDTVRRTHKITHKIVDGDTLEALAKRYLGSAERAAEIYEANRDVLPDPQILPIGVELKIPPRLVPLSPPLKLMPLRRLVPVR